MLETILDKQILFVLMGILTAVGIASKCVASTSLKRMARAAGNMGKSTHPLMRLVRAKFEHACMVSERVENVRVFVDKYLYEYKVAGVKLHTWRRLEKVTAGLCLLLGLLGAVAWYSAGGMSEMVLRTGAAGVGLAVLIYLVHVSTDEDYRLEAAGNYMVDYLENVCLHRYEKAYQKEIQVMAPEAPSAGAAETRGTQLYQEKEIPGIQAEPERPAGPEVQPQPMRPEIRPNAEPQPEKTPRQTPQPETVIPIRGTAPEKDLSEPDLNKGRAAAQAKRQNPERNRKEEEEVQTPKDVLIRQILEEFMA